MIILRLTRRVIDLMVKKVNYSEENGQALIELMFVVILSFIMGVGMYEVGALVHNLSVLNKAMDSAANYASRGAPYEKVKEVVILESNNLMGGAFLEQTIENDFGLILEVWNPETNTKLGAYTEGQYTYRSQCSTSFAPRKENVTPYLFWANGYEIRTGVEYKIGIYIPYIYTIVVSPTISSSKIISVQNDLDRDGMVDSREAGYVAWAMEQKFPSDTQWKNPVHRDETGSLDSSSIRDDIDGDGDTVQVDPLPFDRDNDRVQDKFDKAEPAMMNNNLTMNPLVGPGVLPGTNDWKWWKGTCPP